MMMGYLSRSREFNNSLHGCYRTRPWFLRWAAALAIVLLAGVLAPAVAQDKRPNILLIVADDMGWSDAGVYGGEIFTPNINRLASQGYQFLNFHVGSMCAPTRSMLMTGVDNHIVGLGNMVELLADNQRGTPERSGRNHCHTLARRRVSHLYGGQVAPRLYQRKPASVAGVRAVLRACRGRCRQLRE